MSYSFEGFNEGVLTFSCGGDIAAGTPVKISGNGEVSACSDGDRFCGVAVSCRNGSAGVVLSGAVTLACSGTAPTAGYVKLAADGSGKVKTASGGREYLALDVDSTAGTVTIIL